MGAWIEIGTSSLASQSMRSHPAMGAWIEISKLYVFVKLSEPSHPTMGAWIEIIFGTLGSIFFKCRTPRWVRGLKLYMAENRYDDQQVAPHDGCVD